MSVTLCIALFLSSSGLASGNLYLVSGPGSNPGNFVVLEEETLELIGGPTTIDDVQYTIAFSPDGSHAYITNQGQRSSGVITVVETATNTIIATIDEIPAPFGAAVTPDGSKLLVTSSVDGRTDGLYIVDTENFTVQSPIEFQPGIPTTPTRLAITPDGKTALIPLYATSELAFFDIDSKTVTTLAPLEDQPVTAVISSDGATAYVAIGSGFQKIDIASQSASAAVPLQGRCHDLVLSPDDRLLYLQNEGHGVYVINTSDGSIAANIAVSATFLALSNDGARLFTPSRDDPELFVIDAINFTVATTVPLPEIYQVPGVCPIPGLEILTLQINTGKDQLLTQTNIFAQISWTAPQEQPLNYLITRNGLQIATLTADATSFIDHNLEEGKTYLYEIFAHTESAVIAEGAATIRVSN